VIEDDDRREEGQEPEGAADEQAPPEEPTAAEEPGDDEAPGPEIEGAEQLDAAVEASEEQPAGEEGEEPPAERPPPKRRGKKDDKSKEEVIPGAHLEPDLVLEEERSEEGEFGEFAAVEEPLEEGAEAPSADEAEEAPAEPEPVAHEPLDLATDARYHATGKRKSAIARVILRPGDGTYTINGRPLVDALPRVKLQRMARQPLEAAGYQSRLDVVARIHGGGISAQAGALRHGVARALVEADPSLRLELKRRGFLTRDPRVKERKKAGLKKARKRPQFSKR
jgi:small subunit ribosomal protein S9